VSIDPRHLIGLRARGERIAYGPRDALLYALGVGFGRQVGHAGELGFVYEGGGGPKMVPTFASSIAQSAFLKGCGWNEAQLVPASERLTLHRALPPAATFLLDSEVTAVHDLGADSGALVLLRLQARNAADDQAMFTVERGIMARGDGGCGASLGTVPAPAALPGRPPDLSCELDIAPEQGLVYRLSGDMNPLHADPEVARRAGLPGPVLQNLCTLGVACRGVLETICDFEPTLVTSFEGRYTGGVYPGDRLALELWQQANVLSFRVRVPARDRTVVDNGRCVLAT
jgi:acyl dehydratase